MILDTVRNKIEGTAIPVRGNDIDTDRIIPARFLRCVVFDALGAHAFEDDRLALGRKGQEHPFDQPRFQNANILIANKNFGCGSSREHAPQSLMRWNKGIKAIIAESFAEIFFGNCVSLGIPCVVVEAGTVQKLMDLVESNPATKLTVDVEARVLHVDGEKIPFLIPDGPRSQFLDGRWDSTAELLTDLPAVEKTAANLPYFKHWK
jgi:3-isopropylmalate/(R)-2-methylmalate dehydratase small subunit